MKEKLILTESMVIEIIKKTSLTTLLLLIPIAQFYAALIAFPLFFFPDINQSSELMGYTFGYFYPRSPFTVLIFIIYYLLFFYIYEYRKEKIKKNPKTYIFDKISTVKSKTEYKQKSIITVIFTFIIFAIITILVFRLLNN